MSIRDLCTIRKPAFWHPDPVPSASSKDNCDKSDGDSEHPSRDDSERLGDAEVSVDDTVRLAN